MSADHFLRGRVVVVSPHLDDGVMSLGATIARASRSSARVEVLTVFGCEPGSQAPANGWDTRGGFCTEGEAAAARREEDRAACAAVGAEPHWLPFRGGGYSPDKDEQAIATALSSQLEGADAVLIPGWPLQNDDHAWLAEFFRDHAPAAHLVGRYVEQPYAWTATPPESGWASSEVGIADRLRKRRAVRAYASQLRLLSLGGQKLNRLVLQPERIAWERR